MITHDNIVNYFKEKLATYFSSADNGAYSDFADNMEVYAESSYNSSKDIIITLQFLKGTTQLGFTDLPINVIFEVIEGKATNNKTMANQVMDLINSFIEDKNNKSDLMIDDEGTAYSVTHYYSSTNSIGNGQQRGTNKYKAFTMDMRLIIFDNGYYNMLDETEISFGTGQVKLQNILSVSTSIQHSYESHTAGSNVKQKLDATGIQYQLRLTYIATKWNSLHRLIAADARSDKSYDIKVEHKNFVTRQATMKISDYTEDTPYADVMKVTVAFVEV